MDSRVPIWFGALVGALAGAIGGYLYFTDEGRRLRKDLEPRIGELAREWTHARDAAMKASAAANEGWQSVRQMDQTLRADRRGPERTH
jgi:gas vesicle protein